jgi:hypothetical protein
MNLFNPVRSLNTGVHNIIRLDKRALRGYHFSRPLTNKPRQMSLDSDEAAQDYPS